MLETEARVASYIEVYSEQYILKWSLFTERINMSDEQKIKPRLNMKKKKKTFKRN